MRFSMTHILHHSQMKALLHILNHARTIRRGVADTRPINNTIYNEYMYCQPNKITINCQNLTPPIKMQIRAVTVKSLARSIANLMVKSLISRDISRWRNKTVMFHEHNGPNLVEPQLVRKNGAYLY